MNLLRTSLLACLLVLLSACQTNPVVDSTDDLSEKGFVYVPGKGAFVQHQQHIQQLSSWHINGVFSYSDLEENAASGKISWQISERIPAQGGQKTYQERIRLVGPVGAGVVELIVDQQQARLVSGKQQLIDPTGNVEALLFKAIGWHLPINEMRYWLFGMPATTEQGRYWLDGAGNIQRLQQSGWDIVFSNQQSFSENKPGVLKQHPRKVFAENQLNGVKVRLVAKQISLL